GSNVTRTPPTFGGSACDGTSDDVEIASDVATTVRTNRKAPSFFDQRPSSVDSAGDAPPINNMAAKPKIVVRSSALGFARPASTRSRNGRRSITRQAFARPAFATGAYSG